MAQQFWALVIWFLGVLLCSPVHADLIVASLGDLLWNRTLQPEGPDAVYFSIYSDSNNPAANQLNAFSLGMRILPTAGATGTIEIKSVSLPPVNPVFSTYAGNLPLVRQGDIQTISGENGPFANVTIPDSGRNLFLAQFHSPGKNAQGKFDIYLDRDTTNYFTTTEFDGLKFSNVPSLGDPNGVLIGSFTISVAAVPEPSTLWLGALAMAAVSGRAHRFLRRKPRSHHRQMVDAA